MVEIPDYVLERSRDRLDLDKDWVFQLEAFGQIVLQFTNQVCDWLVAQGLLDKTADGTYTHRSSRPSLIEGVSKRYRNLLSARQFSLPTRLLLRRVGGMTPLLTPFQPRSP